jgi:hypothetical protein
MTTIVYPGSALTVLFAETGDRPAHRVAGRAVIASGGEGLMTGDATAEVRMPAREQGR